MLGRKTFKDEKELHFSLSAHVPEQNFYQQLKQCLNLDFLYKLTGSLVQYYGLHKINVLGISGAHKVMLMAAAAFILRKYMKFKPTKSVSMVKAMEVEQQQAFCSCFLWLDHHFFSCKIKSGLKY
ncbi:hypothetical protein ACMA1I_08570 [Pontibacter sp. 13R65]|uniref:hypothetical protein n=1 Tax=Pontibacter sp. 13R65 TaxID=3127458 RepID=UPI00301BD3DF